MKKCEKWRLILIQFVMPIAAGCYAGYKWFLKTQMLADSLATAGGMSLILMLFMSIWLLGDGV